jgi:hypothetical protein
MRHASLEAFLRDGRAALARGPVAIILAEDQTEVETTLRHHIAAGFAEVLLLAHPDLVVAADVLAAVHRIDHPVHAEAALPTAVNAVIDAAPGLWLYACYNAEYLFHPFCETRNVRELIAFHAEERRDAILSYVIDLYAPDLDRFPDAVSLEEAHLDRSGYYALARPDPANAGQVLERQLDFFGGLRWRFEEHVPPHRRKIDRIALFRAQKGLRLAADFTFNIAEYNTYACAWHHNITTAICSFRTAKALKSNPGSRHDIATFRWHNSTAFQWQSQQLMDLGLMEPGQWF